MKTLKQRDTTDVLEDKIKLKIDLYTGRLFTMLLPESFEIIYRTQRCYKACFNNSNIE